MPLAVLLPVVVLGIAGIGLILHLTGQFHLEDRGVEGFLLQGEEQGVVIEFDRRRRACAVDDARDLAGHAQAAARSGPLQRALESGEFHLRLQGEAPATRRRMVRGWNPALDSRRLGGAGKTL